MLYWSLLSLAILAIPFLVLLLGLLRWLAPTKRINYYFGYRSWRSTRTGELWKYAQSFSEAAASVDAGEADCCLLLESIRTSDIIAISGEKLPERTTRFFPVPWAGFVLNKLDREPKEKPEEKRREDYVAPEAEIVEMI